MSDFIKSRHKSFGFAFQGWAYVLRTQRNTWIHATASIIVIALAYWLGVHVVDWALLILTIAIVWVAEFFNTAIETVVDLTTKEFHPLAKIAKDVAAAGVLITAVASILVGVLILGPHLVQKLPVIFH